MVATLTRIFGIERWNLAEDVVQEALSRALQTWPYRGIPENPSAWIMRASRNLALDVIRREKSFRAKEAEIARLIDLDGSASDAAIFSEHEIADDRLRMMFVCCHSVIPREAQVALALKTLCGFSVAEISHAFLTTEVAIAKRLTRAKQKIQEAQVPFEIPVGDELTRRLDSVLQSLYLLFTLLALMLLNAARIPTRQDDEGNLLRLEEQDRTRWDQAMIARGMSHLHQSAAGEALSEYHLQAGIAACHATATNYSETDWSKILSLYDRLSEFDDSPVVALNRAVAVANVRGPKVGLEAVRAIHDRERLGSYYLLYSVIGELEMRLNNRETAAQEFRRAFELAETKSERAFLLKRLQRCVDGLTS